MKRENKKKVMAASLAALVLVTGTFAWQSFSQKVTNETAGIDGDVGARLHDDFDGQNKDIYVENYASEENGTTVYTRVRLSQYFEYGVGAGTLSTEAGVRGDITIVRGDVTTTTPDINDETTWDVYLYEGPASVPAGESVRDYQKLNFGHIDNSNEGAKIYMPTFNKNADDTNSEINGTLEGSDGIRGSVNKYDDYVTYTDGESKTATAVYSASADAVQNVEGNEIEETHLAKSTLTGSVISMKEWIDNGKTIGNFWVYDTDGWAYWAAGLAPQTATSLLLDGLATVKKPDIDYYYGVHVISQVYTNNDIGVEGGSDTELGIYADGVTDEAIVLLKAINAIELVKVYGIEVLNEEDDTLSDYEKEVAVGSTLTLVADVEATLLNSGDSLNPYEVEWSISSVSKELEQEDLDKTIVDGAFTPVVGMEGNSYKITASSVHKPSISDSVVVNVYDLDSVTISIDTASDSVYKSSGLASEKGNTAYFVNKNTDIQFTVSLDGINNTDVVWELLDETTGLDVESSVATLDQSGKVKFASSNASIADGAILQVTSKVDSTITAKVNLTTAESTVTGQIYDVKDSSYAVITVNGSKYVVYSTNTASATATIMPYDLVELKTFDTGSTTTYVNSAMYTTTLPAYKNALTAPLSTVVKNTSILTASGYSFVSTSHAHLTGAKNCLWTNYDLNNSVVMVLNLETNSSIAATADQTNTSGILYLPDYTFGYLPLIEIEL